jgi:hypothetical protein
MTNGPPVSGGLNLIEATAKAGPAGGKGGACA